MKPDKCTSIQCQGPCEGCTTSHAIYHGEVLSKGRIWRFSFNHQYGATFLNVDGSVRKIQPAEENPVWEKFDEWRKREFGE